MIRTKMKMTILILITLLMVMISGCTNDEVYDVYVTVYPIEYIVKELSHDEATDSSVISVKSIYPRGQDVHDYEPSPKELISFANSKVMFYIGAGLEPYIEDSKTTVLKDTKVINISDYLNQFEDTKLVENNSVHAHGERETQNETADEHLLDSHVWLDPIRMKKASIKIRDVLLEVFPEYSNVFNENYIKLIAKLDGINDDFLETISDIDEAKRYIMVDHDAYEYWTHRYSIKRIKLRNNSETADVELKTFEANVNLAKSLGIKYILSTEHESKCKFFNNYLSELNAQEKSLHHLATITKQEEKEGKDYISIMTNNINVLKQVFPK